MTDRAPSSPAPAPTQALARDEAVPFRMEILKNRSDFLRAARANKQGTAGLMLQARQRAATECDQDLIRIGFTCSKKIGNSVARNRAKRRMREIARELVPQMGRAGWDYVLIGRPGATIDRDFDALRGDLRYALRKVHSPKPADT
ncbi:ribonuclease P protein component [Donghicola sp. C2-DW-16]|uniref:Ribonuclease P protein component n=2 Tax=Donghicola mangrovi TaxID=2729614 RepID=A0A850PYI9_9RHOB|nr:ribonuclease P protein component [Donghicola mangrovi]NVO26514.1 ribonuclease P protein component [Donghicola mangrovi]